MSDFDFELQFEDPPAGDQDVDSDSESADDLDPKFVPFKVFYGKLTGIIERKL
jgi:hypothetical protein